MGSKKDKLIARFLAQPSDFHYKEMVRLLGYFGFEQVKKGRTSGSRVKFMNTDGVSVMMHRPHPSGVVKHYQLKQIKDLLGL